MDHFVEVATDESTGMLAQTEQVFSQEEEVLASVNSEKSRLVSVTIYVTDFADPAYLLEIALVAAVN
jgi:enamine deaminase RidA (YjgF/YER057c/UK114 family)